MSDGAVSDQSNEKQKKPAKRFLILALVFFIIVFSVLLIIFWNDQWQRDELRPALKMETPLPEKQESKRFLNYESGSITVVTGKITSFKDRILSFQVLEGEENPLLKGKTFNTQITEKTKLFLLRGGAFSLIKINNQTELMSDDSNNNEQNDGSRQEIEITDLKHGDLVVILPEVAISNPTENETFKAKEIYKINK